MFGSNMKKKLKRIKKGTSLNANSLALCAILSYSISQNERIKFSMTKRITAILLCSLCLFLLAAGCRTQNQLQQKQNAFVTTYAELLLLHEKEKMRNHLPDSLYQMKVDTFFLQHHTTKEQFRNTMADISADPENWKNFLQDVNRAVDSIRSRRQ
jgi:hypothetical protein